MPSYAQKLSYKEEFGSVGMPKFYDPNKLLQQKIEKLAWMIKKSKHLVAFTGAGISTSFGIPDFRRPKGVSTLQHEGKGVPQASLPFDRAMPSITHMALVELERAGILKFVITQNVDSLHLRSGIPREKLSELHGNSFKEVCPSCGAEYVRDFEVETIGLKETPRRCSAMNCTSKLRDSVLGMKDELPRKEMDLAERHCQMADLVLCLGTSLQITPACNLPSRFGRGWGEIVIVNLQQTPEDNKAKLVIHGLVDKVILGVMQILNMRIPPYVRIDLFQINYSRMSGGIYESWSVEVCSVNGKSAPLPFIKSVEVSFPGRQDLKKALVQQQPFELICHLTSKQDKAELKLNFIDGCAILKLRADYQASTNYVCPERHVVFQNLRNTAGKSGFPGQLSVVEKKLLSAPFPPFPTARWESITYAFVTNIIKYAGLPKKEDIVNLMEAVSLDEDDQAVLCSRETSDSSVSKMVNFDSTESVLHSSVYYGKSKLSKGERGYRAYMSKKRRRMSVSLEEDVGSVGMTEFFDPNKLLQQKIEKLARMIEKSKHLVAFTGAGISASCGSCGIHDIRGPKGVSTLQHEGKGVPQASLPLDRAMPSITHMALVELEKSGILKFVISKNVDNLHLRSGIPREKLSELHGNSFREVCPSCGAEYVRDFEVETIGLKETPRRCSAMNCTSGLRDSVLDMKDQLPRKEMDLAEKHCQMADVVLCLGTSLQITPACNLPLRSLRGGGEIVIVNLQQTPEDKKAKLVIHGLVDKVILGAMQILNMRIPPYVRIDLFQINYRCNAGGNYARWSIEVCSVHGESAPLPFIKSVEVSFPERQDLETALLQQQPFSLKRKLRTKPVKVVLKLNFSDGCACPFTTVKLQVDFQASTDYVSPERNVVFQNLRDTAVKSECCGQLSVVEKKMLSAPAPTARRESMTYAIVTNIIEYAGLPKKEKEIVNLMEAVTLGEFDDQAVLCSRETSDSEASLSRWEFGSGLGMRVAKPKKEKYMIGRMGLVPLRKDYSSSSSMSKMVNFDSTESVLHSSVYYGESELSKGERGYRAYMSKKGGTHKKLAQADEKTRLANFKARNETDENQLTVDLHGLNVEVAMDRVKMNLALGALGGAIKSLRVITGCGNHSVGMPMVKPMVLNLCRMEGIRCVEDEENPGVLLMWLDGRTGFAFLDSEL